MNRIALAAVLSLAFGSTIAQANQNLQVMFDGQGCPTEVISHDGNCGNNQPNVACRKNNGPVRWAPVNMISDIITKGGSGGLHNCQAKPNQGYFQCIVRGNVGDEIEYDVISTTGCGMDPVIIVQ